MKKNAKATRRTLIGVIAVAALTVPVAVASADGSSPKKVKKAESVSVEASYGAYSGRDASGEAKPFDPTIENNSLAVDPDGRIAVATNSKSHHLVVIDVDSGAEIHRIRGYISPRNILFAPDGKTFTVSDSTLGVVDRIDAFNFRKLDRLPLGAGVFGTAQSDDGKWLYATNPTLSTVTKVKAGERRVEEGGILTGFDHPRQGIKVGPEGDKLFVTNYETGKEGHVAVVDLATGKTKKITGFSGLRAISISGDGNRLYAANSAEGKVSIIDLTSGAHTKVPVGDKPYGAALSPDEKVLFSGSFTDNTLTAINPLTGETIGMVKDEGKVLFHPRQAISFSADSKTAWVLNEDLTIVEIDVDSLEVTDHLGVPTAPPR